MKYLNILTSASAIALTEEMSPTANGLIPGVDRFLGSPFTYSNDIYLMSNVKKTLKTLFMNLLLC